MVYLHTDIVEIYHSGRKPSNYVNDARWFRALQTLGAKRKSGGLGRYECKRVKVGLELRSVAFRMGTLLTARP